MIYIGTYKPGEKGQIQVDLTLNKDTGLEYCDLLTKNDWKFMVTEETDSETPDNLKTPKTPKTPKTINPPKTGDSSNIAVYIAIMASAISVIAVTENRRKKYHRASGEK